MSNQPLEYVGIEKLPVVAELVAGMLEDGKTTYALFAQAQGRPNVLDKATIERASHLMTDRLAILAHEDKQIEIWKQEQEGKTEVQQQLETLQANVAASRQVCQEILSIL